MTEKIPYIRAEKTILRPVSENDVSLFVRWYNDPETRSYYGHAFPVMEYSEREWIKKCALNLEKRTDFTFVIETFEGEPIGNMSLHRVDFMHRSATTGACIANPSYRNSGYGSTTKMHLLRWAFHELNLNRINSSVLSTNPRSVKYSERCGYRVEGIRREALYKDGKYVDEIVLGLLRKEWEPLWEQYQKTGRLK